MNVTSMMPSSSVATPEPACRPGRRPQAEAFVDFLAREARTHRAIQHPYLDALAKGRLPDLRWALADFARHYAGYARYFRCYLGVLTAQLSDPRHREGLLENLAEESGRYSAAELAELAAVGIEPEWIVGVPHPELFRRFCTALDVAPPGPRDEAAAVVHWRELFLGLLDKGPEVAVGALGLGTENVVQPIYASFCRALERLPELRPEHTVFFPLHAAVDDHHAASLRMIAEDFAGSASGRRLLRQGMHAALMLRGAFWDWLHARALDPAAAP